METKLNVRGGDLPEHIQETIKNKVAKLPRFFDRVTGIQVVADMQHADTPNVEVIVAAEEVSDFFATGTGSNVLAALDDVMNKLESQLRKHKEKLKGHRSKEINQPDAP